MRGQHKPDCPCKFCEVKRRNIAKRKPKAEPTETPTQAVEKKIAEATPQPLAQLPEPKPEKTQPQPKTFPEKVAAMEREKRTAEKVNTPPKPTPAPATPPEPAKPAEPVKRGFWDFLRNL